jgi:CBS domain containing-hemolysin-like protein
MEAGRLEELLEVRLAEDWHATTVGGLITEIAGHIPHPGEVVQEGDLRFEVIESTARRVSKVRVLTRPPNPVPPNSIPLNSIPK